MRSACCMPSRRQRWLRPSDGCGALTKRPALHVANLRFQENEERAPRSDSALGRGAHGKICGLPRLADLVMTRLRAHVRPARATKTIWSLI